MFCQGSPLKINFVVHFNIMKSIVSINSINKNNMGKEKQMEMSCENIHGGE